MKNELSAQCLVNMMRQHLKNLSLDQRFAYAVRLLWMTPYNWGQETILGTDCSGSVAWGLYLLGFSIRVTAQEFHDDLTLPVPAGSEVEAGYLCFFWDKEDTKIQHVVVFSDETIIMDADKRFMDTPLWKEAQSRGYVRFTVRRLNWQAIESLHLRGGRAFGLDEELKPLLGVLKV
jgi:hypothetical protein